MALKRKGLKKLPNFIRALNYKDLQRAKIQIEHINAEIRDSYMDKESLMPVGVFEMSFSRSFGLICPLQKVVR